MSYIPGLALSTKGDLASSDGSTAVVVPVGVNGQRLTARSSAAPGVAWEGDAAISKSGSIFSMDGPGGAPGAAVAYDFTQFDPTKTLTQNLQGANISGVATFDLLAVNAPVYDYSSKLLAGNGLYPYQSSVLGGGLQVNNTAATTNGATTNLGADDTLRITGALTFEMLVEISALSTTNGDTLYFFGMQKNGETENDNWLYGLYLAVSAGPVFTLTYFAEHGAGVNITGSIAALPSLIGLGPQHIAVTRLSTGEVVGYVNGRRVSALVTPVDAGGGGIIVPTRGAAPAQNLIVGVINTNGTNTNLWQALKITPATFTDAQVQESYRKTFYGK